MIKESKRKTYEKICLNCGERFIAKRPHALYCDASCRMELWREEHPYVSAQELKAIKEKLNIK